MNSAHQHLVQWLRPPPQSLPDISHLVPHQVRLCGPGGDLGLILREMTEPPLDPRLRGRERDMEERNTVNDQRQAVGCHMSGAICRVPYVGCHMSGAICRVPYVGCHMYVNMCAYICLCRGAYHSSQGGARCLM